MKNKNSGKLGKKTANGLKTMERVKEILIKFVKRKGGLPTLGDLIEWGVTQQQVRGHYGTLGGLFETYRDEINLHLGKPSYSPQSKYQLSIKEKGVYIITSHQNDTKINTPFLESLLTLKKHLKAKLVVIPTYYQTRGAYGNMEPKWSEELNPYYQSRPFKLNQYLEICAGLPINATAENPLSGLHAITGIASCIIPHPQLMVEYVAVPADAIPKVMMTTGSISQKNYTRSKAGAKGSFHHTASAIVVYIDDDIFYPFIVNADRSGGFYHLNHYYTGEGRTETEYKYNLVVGDLHCEWMDPTVMNATWVDDKSIVKALPIGTQCWHDVIDFNSKHSHHNRKDKIYQMALDKAGKGDAEWCLSTTAKVVSKLLDNSPNTNTVHIVDSNHHDHVYRFLNELSVHELKLPDKKLYHSMWLELLDKAEIDHTNTLQNADCLKIYFNKALKKEHKKMLSYADSNKQLMLYGVDCSQHGHRGPNGTFGSDTGFAKTNYKISKGHTHSPGLNKGVMTAGHCGESRRNYTHGYSSWMHSHILGYPNGKRTFLTIIKGRWIPEWASL